MKSVFQSLLTDIGRIRKLPMGDKTLPELRSLHTKVMDFADSLAPKEQGRIGQKNFEEAIDPLTETADSLDEACDAHELAEDEDSREEALESANETLEDLANALEELQPFAQYIETTNEIVAARWAGELARLSSLAPRQSRAALDMLLSQARTPKESFTLMTLAKSASASRPR